MSRGGGRGRLLLAIVRFFPPLASSPPRGGDGGLERARISIAGKGKAAAAAAAAAAARRHSFPRVVVGNREGHRRAV